MDITIFPKKLSGTVYAIPSKSQAHRLLICSAFCDTPVNMEIASVNEDIMATVDCLRALGANITQTKSGFHITPIATPPKNAMLNCRESGSTLRFMLPIVGSLGVNTRIYMSGRLPERPLSPLWEEMERMGCRLTRPGQNVIQCQGQLKPGHYTIPGNISSQYITGLMFALALLPGQSQLHITGETESAPYVEMTKQVLQMFGVSIENGAICHCFPFHAPDSVSVEGDWSNGAFFLAAQALGNDITVSGLSLHSAQGDKAICDLLKKLSQHCIIDGRNIPDLIPVLAVVSGTKKGAEFQNIGRLRLKESDRIASTAQMLQALGAGVHIFGDTMSVTPGAYHSCTIDAQNDHRIAMAAAIASTVSQGKINVLGANCVKKSYPDFWSVFTNLGGYYEQYIR